MNYTEEEQTVLKSDLVKWLMNEFDYVDENDVEENFFMNNKNNFLLFYADGFNMFEIVDVTENTITFKYIYSEEF